MDLIEGKEGFLNKKGFSLVAFSFILIVVFLLGAYLYFSLGNLATTGVTGKSIQVLGGENSVMGVGQNFMVQGGEPTGYFVFQIQTTQDNQNFSFVTDDAVDLFVDWGDGTNDTYSGTGTVIRTHIYSTAGIYNVSLRGYATRIAFWKSG